MKINFYTNLAKKNIKSNSQTYGAFIFATTLSFMMYATINSLITLYVQSSTIANLITIGKFVVAFFSLIFIFYGNKFLIKRRTKEIGLYSILGLEKKHIAIILFFEFLFSFIASVIIGEIASLLFGKLVFLILNKMTTLSMSVGNISYKLDLVGFPKTLVVFSVIFLLNYVYSLAKLSFLNPIQLLKNSKKGERRSKASWLKTIIGILCLGGGYGLALHANSIMQAFTVLFPAIILVIIGTFFLFGSILNFFLHRMKKRNSYYTQAHKFIFTSGMIFRMGQNAKGLASICVLLTMVFISVSSTISVHNADKRIVNSIYPCENLLDLKGGNIEIRKTNQIIKEIQELSNANKIETSDFIFVDASAQIVNIKNNTCKGVGQANIKPSLSMVWMTSLPKVQRFFDEHITLKENEIIIIVSGLYIDYTKSFEINGLKFTLKIVSDKITKQIKQSPYFPKMLAKTACIIFRNNAELEKAKIQLAKIESNKPIKQIPLKQIFWNAHKKGLNKKEMHDFYNNAIQKLDKEDGVSFKYSSKQGTYLARREFSGSLLFLGIFLSLLFLLWLLLIMYFKQVSESYEDRQKYQIMKKIGMDTSLIKKTTNAQIVWMFFLPLSIAIIHCLFGANLFMLFLHGAGVIYKTEFLSSLGVTVLVVSIIYAFFYLITSKRYNKNI